MKKAKFLKENRAQKIEAQSALLNNAKSEDREFTDSEKETFNTLNREIDDLNLQVVQAEAQEAAEARAAEFAASRQEPGKAPVAETSMEGFDLLRYVQNHRLGRAHTGAEAAMFEYASQEARAAGAEINGLPLPMEALSRAITVGGNGANWVPTEQGAFIDALSEALVMPKLGATMMSGLVGDVELPRLVGGSATWEGETDANADSGADTEKVTLTPKRVGAVTTLSTKFLAQTTPTASAMFARDLVRSIALAIDHAAINGSGGTQPTGILNTSGIGSVAIGTNGGAPTWASMVKLEEEVAVDNAEVGALNYLTNPKVRSVLKTTSKDAGSGQFIWAMNEVNGYPAHISNGVPSDLTKGTGTALSAAIYGNFNDLVIGTWGVVDLIVDPYTKKTTGQVEIAANMFADVAVRHAQSFAAVKDLVA